MSETLHIHTSGGDMPAHLWRPEGGRGPGIVLLQEIFGVSAYIRRRAHQLADLGYVVVAPEIYWRLGAEAMEPIEGPDALAKGVGFTSRLDWDAAVADAVATVLAVRARGDVSGQVGVVGFCFGGGLGFAAASALESADPEAGAVDALVSYYGSALPGIVDHQTVTAPSLHHFGLADDFIPLEAVRHIEEVVTRQPRTTFITHEGANHAFDNDDAPWFNGTASGQAWGATVAFLGDRLPVGVA